MLKVNEQVKLSLSSHAVLYDTLIKKNNFWRQLKESVDFSFVYEELKDKNSSTMGRKAEDVIRMFKYLLLKNYGSCTFFVGFKNSGWNTQCIPTAIYFFC